MKTTLDLNDALLTEAKTLAAQERTSLTRLIEEGLQLRLRPRMAQGKRVRLPVYRGKGGLVSGVDGLSNKSMRIRRTLTPDVNVLVAASRSDHPHHAVASAWLELAITQAAQGRLLKLQPMVIASFLRLVTHPRIFVQPTPISEALRFIDALLGAAGTEQPSLGPEWSRFSQLCVEKAVAANDVPDAWLAAAVLHQGEHLVSFDADFKRLLPRAQFTRLTV